jgi:TPR repeat protein
MRALLLLALSVLAVPAHAVEPPDPFTLETVARVNGKKAWVNDAAVCPALLMPSRAATATAQDETCYRTPTAACLARCESGSAGACYWLGQALMQRKAPDHADEVLFQRSCKLGHASGCTNRAAGMLMEQSDALPAQQCAARTFEKTCALDDPWGCTMLGLHLSRGLGVAPNPERALEVMRKSCKFGTDDPACSYAMRIRQDIEQARGPAKK